MKAIWSHPFPAIWHHPKLTYPYVFRGPNMREQMFYLYEGDPYVSVSGHMRKLGLDIDKVAKFDGKPPCIFCGESRATHGDSFCGEICRPTCIMQECNKDTCVQALVGGYQPTCLQHFFNERIAVRAKL